jgi:hypothetical protein
MMRLSQNLWCSVNPGYYVRNEQELCSTAKADFTWDPEEVKAHHSRLEEQHTTYVLTVIGGKLQHYCPCDKAHLLQDKECSVLNPMIHVTSHNWLNPNVSLCLSVSHNISHLDKSARRDLAQVQRMKQMQGASKSFNRRRNDISDYMEQSVKFKNILKS